MPYSGGKEGGHPGWEGGDVTQLSRKLSTFSNWRAIFFVLVDFQVSYLVEQNCGGSYRQCRVLRASITHLNKPNILYGIASGQFLGGFNKNLIQSFQADSGTLFYKFETINFDLQCLILARELSSLFHPVNGANFFLAKFFP